MSPKWGLSLSPTVAMEYNKDQIIFAVRKIFRNEDQNKVLEELNLEDSGSIRVYLAVLKLSKGNLKDFYLFLKKSQEDYRDVLWQAEYEENGEKELINPYKQILT